MAETKNAAPDQEYNDDGTKNPDFVAPKTEDEKKTDTDADKDKDIEKDKDGNPIKKEDEKDFDDEAAPVVPVRKSVAEHIITRKNEKIKKLESKIKEKDEDDDDGDTDEDDDSLTPEAREVVNKEIDKKVKPIVDALTSKADKEELDELFTSEPEAKKYEKHIRAYASHDAYKGVPPAVIYHHLAFQNAQAIGAKKKAVADKEADHSKGGGRKMAPKDTGVDGIPTAEDIADMSEEEFTKMEQDAIQGKFIKK